MQALSTSYEPVAPVPTVLRPLLPEGLSLPYPKGNRFVPADHILALSGDRNYTRFHFRDGRTFLYSKTLREILSRLPAHAFTRIHRSHAVNRQHIRTVFKDSIVLVDGSEWGVSRRKRGKSKRLVVVRASRPSR
ncbi:LytR/AlgR family response regulator transcription factor [Persicitalea sp.]|uniref:LytR/AlgR family response regulator transcription factor n=1 Tax=Persicitalea sp. TaxID=3100273 RepID=UPI0035935F9B